MDFKFTSFLIEVQANIINVDYTSQVFVVLIVMFF